MRESKAIDLRPGDSFSSGPGGVVLLVKSAVRVDDMWEVRAEQPDHSRKVFHFAPDDVVTVGFTNRRAKRQRGKYRRRLRFALRDQALGDSP